MGSLTLRTYHDVVGDDRSGLLAQVIAQRERVRRRLEAVRRVVAVMSGKGGVGKSYVAAALARTLAPRLARGIGVLDADLAGPTAARMLGATGPLIVHDDVVRPAIGHDGVKVVSMELLLDDGKPLAWREPAHERFVWRGTLEAGVVREFLSDVDWGALDLLLIDLPPGSDRLADLAQLVPDLSGAIAVTIPSEESHRSVERSMHAAAAAGVHLLGVIENMSGYACAGCGTVRPLFTGDAGHDLATEFDVPLFGRIPFAPPLAHAPFPEAVAERVLEVLA